MPFSFLLLLFSLLVSYCSADQVIMKDGTIYKGKILHDGEKAVLIGNPPFDPNQYLLESKDIQTIIYEEYKQLPPLQRRRGFFVGPQLSGNFTSSDQLSLNPHLGLGLEAGFRLHPACEIEGGIEWRPSFGAKNTGLLVSDGTSSRQYDHFHEFRSNVSGRFYPFFIKEWKWDPYLLGGYHWSRLTADGTDDNVRGSGFHVGTGVLFPLTTHLFLDPQFLFQKTTYGKITFADKEGNIRPEIEENEFSLILHASYRF